ncbi:MAG: hypothetical protein KGI52_08440 [Burkholderiales bacterium]|nr:hypothetical protein [Burkholderiales bacterium]
MKSDSEIMDGLHERLSDIRSEIDRIGSPEMRLMARFVEAHSEIQLAETREMKEAYRTAKGITRAVRVLASFGAAAATIWAAAKGLGAIR